MRHGSDQGPLEQVASIAVELETCHNLLSDLRTLQTACSRLGRLRDERREKEGDREELELQVKLLHDELQQERRAREELTVQHETLYDMLKKTYGQLVDDLLGSKQALHTKEKQIKDLTRRCNAANQDQDLQRYAAGDPGSSPGGDKPTLRLLNIQQQFRAIPPPAAHLDESDATLSPDASPSRGPEAQAPPRGDGSRGQAHSWHPQYWLYNRTEQGYSTDHTWPAASTASGEQPPAAPWSHAALSSALRELSGGAASLPAGARHAAPQHQPPPAPAFAAAGVSPFFHDQAALPPAQNLPSRVAPAPVLRGEGPGDSSGHSEPVAARTRGPWDSLHRQHATRLRRAQPAGPAAPAEDSFSSEDAGKGGRLEYDAGPSSSSSGGSPWFPGPAPGLGPGPQLDARLDEDGRSPFPSSPWYPEPAPGLGQGPQPDARHNNDDGRSPFPGGPGDALDPMFMLRYPRAADAAASSSAHHRTSSTWASSSGGGGGGGGAAAGSRGGAASDRDQEQQGGGSAGAVSISRPVAAVSGGMARFLRTTQSSGGAAAAPPPQQQQQQQRRHSLTPPMHGVPQGGQPATASPSAMADEPSSELLFRAIKGQLENLQAVFNADFEHLTGGDAQQPRQEQQQDAAHSYPAGGAVDCGHSAAAKADLDGSASSSLVWPEVAIPEPGPGAAGEQAAELTPGGARRQDAGRAHSSRPQGFVVVGRGAQQYGQHPAASRSLFEQ